MIRVLVVDDDALALELHSAYVERVPGFEVVGHASGARAAVTALADPGREIDLVLLDMTMPDGSGLDVARRLRATGSHVDIIAVTAVRDAATVRAAVSIGVVQYLIKPFAFAAFRERLEAYRSYVEGLDRAAGEATQSEVDALLGSPSSLPFTVPGWALKSTKADHEETWEVVSKTSKRGVFICQLFVLVNGEYLPNCEPEVEVENFSPLGAVDAHYLAKDIVAAASAILSDSQPEFAGGSTD